MNTEMQHRQRKILVIVQIAIAAIGLFLTIVDLVGGNYETFGEAVGSFVILPLALAGLARFGVRAYQVASIKLGAKIYDEDGNCLTVARRGLGVAVGIACPLVLIGVCTMFTPVLTKVLAVLLIVVAVFLFVTDVRFLKLAKKSAE